MKTLGMLGGMSWESTAHYYRLINEGVRNNIGGLHSAKILLYSVDFHEIEALQSIGDWEQAGSILSKAAYQLQQAGAEGLILCTNTMHKVATQIEQTCSIPFIHIADATGDAIREKKINKVALLGTRYTMEQDFYKDRLEDRYSISTIVPNIDEQDQVNRIIFDELCQGKFYGKSANYYIKVIDSLSKNGAEGIIFGCTEIGLLIPENSISLPVFDTAEIHVKKAIDFIFS